MWGRATLITVTSRTCITVTVMTVTVMAQRRRALRGASKSGVWAASAVAVVISGPLWREGRRRHRMSGRASRRSWQSEGERSIHALALRPGADLAHGRLRRHESALGLRE